MNFPSETLSEVIGAWDILSLDKCSVLYYILMKLTRTLKMQKKRSIVFMGIPTFPIAVERALSSGLKERPIILVKTLNPRSRCLSVSIEARHFGIQTGMSLHDAKRRSRDISVLLPNPSLYKRAMDAIQKVICDFTPLCEPVRIKA